MAFTVYDGIAAYAKRAHSAFYQACKTAIFNDPQNQYLTPKGKVTMIRQYSAGGAGTYSKTKGWMTSYGSGQGIEWIPYKSEFDRAKIMMTDAIDEEQSFAVGMTPSIELLNSDFLNNHLPREVDATNIAKWYSQIPAANRHINTEAGYDTSPEGILATLTSLEMQIFDSGYDRDTVLFISPQVKANLVTAIQNKMGLASNVMMTREATVYIDAGLGALLPGTDDMIAVKIEFEVYGKFLLVTVPTDRMCSNIIMYSGDPNDAGQEMGGYVPDYANANFCNIEMLAIPIEAAFTNMRYMVDNFLYPAYLQSNAYTRVDLRKLNERMFGFVEINNAGINQKANAFEYDVRAIYGGSLFDNRARNCFAVTGPKGAQPLVTQIAIAGEGDATEVEVGQTLSLIATITPATAANKTVSWSVTEGSDYASVSSAGIVTGLVAGEATITAAAQDGSGVTGTIEITVKEAGA